MVSVYIFGKTSIYIFGYEGLNYNQYNFKVNVAFRIRSKKIEYFWNILFLKKQ